MNSNRIRSGAFIVVALVSFSTQAMLQVGVRVGAALAGGALGEKACENYNEAKKILDDPRYPYAVRYPALYEKIMSKYQSKGSFQQLAPDYVQDLAQKYAQAAGLECYEGLFPIYVSDMGNSMAGFFSPYVGKICLNSMMNRYLHPSRWDILGHLGNFLIDRERLERLEQFTLAHELMHGKQSYDREIAGQSCFIGWPFLGATGCFSKALTGKAHPLAIMLLGAAISAPLVDTIVTNKNVCCKQEVEADLGAFKTLFDLREDELIQGYLSDLDDGYKGDGHHAHNDEGYHYLSSYYQALQEKRWLASVPYSYKWWGWNYVVEKQRQNKEIIRKELQAVDELIATHSKADLHKLYEKRCEEYDSIESEPFSWHQPSAEEKERYALAYFHLRLQGKRVREPDFYASKYLFDKIESFANEVGRFAQ